MAVIAARSWRRTVRRGLVVVLSWVADQLRDEVEVASGDAFASAGARATSSRAPAPSPRPSAAPSAPAEPAASTAASADADTDSTERVGAARYVDEHQAAAPSASSDALLMAGLSGDLGPAVAERVEQAREAGEGSALHDAIIDMLHTIYDPEIPVDIYELGLIYAVDIQDDAHVQVKMTLTSPNCPAAQSLPGEVETKVGAVPGVASAEVEVVFEPPWTPDLMTEEARLELNLM